MQSSALSAGDLLCFRNQPPEDTGCQTCNACSSEKAPKIFAKFTPEFKEEAVRQITERGYSITEVSDRLGVSTHSLYKWLRAIKPDNSEQHARDLLEAKSEILKLRAQLKRIEEERDILKKAARYFAREPD
ncbi:transposase [Salmonella enterica subsp. enterica]|nr:transposase [Salmonella enterica subsp. enterica]